MSWFSRTPAPSNNAKLILDIGSSSVGASLVEFRHNSKNNITSSIIKSSLREEISIQDDLSYGRLLSLVKSALEKVLNRMLALHQGTPNEISIVLHAPWYSSQARTISYKKNSPFEVTEKLVHQLTDKELQIFMDSHMKEYGGEDPIVIESNIERITLNGYPTENAFGRQTNEISINLFFSIAPSHLLMMVREAIMRTYHSKKAVFSTFATVSFATIRNTLEQEHDYIIMDISGEITDCILVNKGSLASTVSFPQGANAIYRLIKRGAGLPSLSQAKAQALLVCDKRASSELDAKLCPLIDKAGEAWRRSFQKCFAGLPSGLVVPRTIFLVVDGELSKWYKEVLTKEEFHQLALMNGKFNVIIVSNETLREHVHIEEGVTTDPFIILESLFSTHYRS